MPTLPVYNSQRNITANPAAPFRNEASQPFQDQQKVLGTLNDIAQQWSNANDVMQYTDARAKYETSTLDIQNRAFSDPDFNNTGRYLKELEDAKRSSLKGISNQQVVNKLGAELDHSNNLTAYKIGADASSKQLEYNKVQFGTNLDILQSKKLAAITQSEAMQYDSQINELIGAQLKSGVLSPKEAKQYLYNSTKKSYENLIYTDPQRGIEALNNDSSLTASEKGKLIQQAHQIEKRDKEFQEWQIKQVNTQSTIDLSQALHDGTLTTVMVRDMQQKGLIDNEVAATFDSLAINKKFDIPADTKLTDVDYLLRLLDDAHGDKSQIDKVLKSAAEAYGNDKLGINQYRYFVENAKENFGRQSKGINSKSEKQTQTESSINGIKEFFSTMGESRKDEMAAYDKFFDRFVPGSDPNTIKNEIINEQILKIKPEVATFPSEGKIMVDKNGNKAKVFPDGHIEEIK